MAIQRLTPEQALGMRIKELRARIPLTQEELAESSGQFRTYVSRVEAGRANPTVRVIYRFAQALGVEVAELFETPAPSPKRVKSANPLSRGRISR